MEKATGSFFFVFLNTKKIMLHAVSFRKHDTMGRVVRRAAVTTERSGNKAVSRKCADIEAELAELKVTLAKMSDDSKSNRELRMAMDRTAGDLIDRINEIEKLHDTISSLKLQHVAAQQKALEDKNKLRGELEELSGDSDPLARIKETSMHVAFLTSELENSRLLQASHKADLARLVSEKKELTKRLLDDKLKGNQKESEAKVVLETKIAELEQKYDEERDRNTKLRLEAQIEIQNLQRQVGEKNTTIQTIENLNADLKRKKADGIRRLDDLSADFEKAERHLSNLLGELRLANELLIKDYKKELTALRKEADTSRDTATRLSSDLMSLQSQLHDAREATNLGIETEKRKVADLESRIAHLQSKIASATSDELLCTEKIGRLESEIKQLRENEAATRSALDASQSQLAAELQNCQKNIDTQVRKIAHAMQSTASAVKQAKRWKKEATKLTDSKGKLESQIATLEAKLKENANELTALRDSGSMQNQTIQQLTENEKDCTRKLEKLRDELEKSKAELLKLAAEQARLNERHALDIANLTRDVTESQASVQQAITLNQQLQSSLSKEVLEKEQALKDVIAMKGASRSESVKYRELQNAVEKTERELALATQQTNDLKREKQHLEGTNKDLQEKYVKLQGALQLSSSAKTTAVENMQEAQRKLDEVESRNKELQSLLDVCNTKATETEAALWTLRDVRSSLERELHEKNEKGRAVILTELEEVTSRLRHEEYQRTILLGRVDELQHKLVESEKLKEEYIADRDAANAKISALAKNHEELHAVKAQDIVMMKSLRNQNQRLASPVGIQRSMTPEKHTEHDQGEVSLMKTAQDAHDPEMQTNMARLRKQKLALETEVHGLIARNNKLETENATATRLLLEKITRLDAEQVSRDEAHIREVHRLKGEMEALSQQNQDDVDRLTAQAVALQQRISTLEGELRSSKKERESADAVIFDTKASLLEKILTISRLTQDLGYFTSLCFSKEPKECAEHLKRELAFLTNDNDDLAEERKDLAEQGNKLREEVTALREKGSKLEKEVKTLREARNDLEEDLNTLSEESKTLREGSNKLSDENSELHRKLDSFLSLCDENDDTLKCIGRLAHAKDALRIISSLESTGSGEKPDGKKTYSPMGIIERYCNKQKTELASVMNSELDEARSHVNALTENNDALKKDLTLSQNAKKTLETTVHKITEERDTIAKERDAFSNQLNEMRAKIQENESKIQSMVIEKRSLDVTIKDLEEANTQLSQYIQTIEQSIRANLEQAKSEVQSARAETDATIDRINLENQERVSRLETVMETKNREMRDMEIQIEQGAVKIRECEEKRENLTRSIDSLQKINTRLSLNLSRRDDASDTTLSSIIEAFVMRTIEFRTSDVPKLIDDVATYDEIHRKDILQQFRGVHKDILDAIKGLGYQEHSRLTTKLTAISNRLVDTSYTRPDMTTKSAPSGRARGSAVRSKGSLDSASTSSINSSDGVAEKKKPTQLLLSTLRSILHGIQDFSWIQNGIPAIIRLKRQVDTHDMNTKDREILARYAAYIEEPYQLTKRAMLQDVRELRAGRSVAPRVNTPKGTLEEYIQAIEVDDSSTGISDSDLAQIIQSDDKAIELMGVSRLDSLVATIRELQTTQSADKNMLARMILMTHLIHLIKNPPKDDDPGTSVTMISIKTVIQQLFTNQESDPNENESCVMLLDAIRSDIKSSDESGKTEELTELKRSILSLIDDTVPVRAHVHDNNQKSQRNRQMFENMSRDLTEIPQAGKPADQAHQRPSSTPLARKKRLTGFV